MYLRKLHDDVGESCTLIPEFRTITGNLSSIREASNIVLLSIATALIPAFIFWMNHQEIKGRPALIPNSLWKKTAFAAICIMVMLDWAALNSMEIFFSL